MKRTAHVAVIFVRTVVGPALPKIVWLEAPPNVEPIEAPLPIWRSTVIIITILTMICMTETKVDIKLMASVNLLKATQ